MASCHFKGDDRVKIGYIGKKGKKTSRQHSGPANLLNSEHNPTGRENVESDEELSSCKEAFIHCTLLPISSSFSHLRFVWGAYCL